MLLDAPFLRMLTVELKVVFLTDTELETIVRPAPMTGLPDVDPKVVVAAAVTEMLPLLMVPAFIMAFPLMVKASPFKSNVPPFMV